MRLRDDSDGGFTLLETLVVLTLLGMFSLLWVGALRLAFATDDHVQAETLRTSSASALARFFEKHLGDARPVWMSSNNPGYVDFEGGASNISFLARTPLSLGGIGLSRYKLAVESDRGESRLLVDLETEDTPNSKLHTQSVLASNLTGVSFSYFGNKVDERVPGWQPSWVHRPVLPSLISVQLVGNNPSARGSQSIIIRPHIDIDVACEVNLQAARCVGR